MTVHWWDLFLIALWALWGTQATLSMLQVRKFRRHLRRSDRPGFNEFRPPAVVIVPFKGIDHEAVANLHGLFKQDYPQYRLILVVESEDDPAYGFLRSELTKLDGVPVNLIVAGEAADDTGQKVHNLLAALSHLESTRDTEAHPDEVWAFADSDAVPHARWLGDLVGPLVQDDLTAVTTGYRWMVPARGPVSHFKLGSRFASVINSSIACFAAHDKFSFAWGGSMAMLARTAREGDLHGHWRGALSDDFQVTLMARKLGRRIYYLPECIVESPIDMRFADLAEFARRQYLITRVHSPAIYYKGTLVVLLYLLATLAAWSAATSGIALQNWVLAVPAGLTVVYVAVLNQIRAGYRRQAIRELFGSGTYQRLHSALLLDRFGTTAVFAVNAALLLSAITGNTIAWRGKRYRMDGPNQVARLA